MYLLSNSVFSHRNCFCHHVRHTLKSTQLSPPVRPVAKLIVGRLGPDVVVAFPDLSADGLVRLVPCLVQGCQTWIPEPSFRADSQLQQHISSMLASYPQIQTAPSDDCRHLQLLIHGYPPATTQEVLVAALSKYGDITSVDIHKPGSNPKYPNGYAFVSFRKEEQATRCQAELNRKSSLSGTETQQQSGSKESITVLLCPSEYELRQHLKLFPPTAAPKPDRPAPLPIHSHHPTEEREEYKKRLLESVRRRNLYVRDFPLTYTDEDLKKLFEPFGEITSCQVMRDEDGTSRGFGFCCFATDIAARNAYITMDGKEVSTGSETFTLYINYAIPKAELANLRQHHSRGRREISPSATTPSSHSPSSHSPRAVEDPDHFSSPSHSPSPSSASPPPSESKTVCLSFSFSCLSFISLSILLPHVVYLTLSLHTTKLSSLDIHHPPLQTPCKLHSPDMAKSLQLISTSQVATEIILMVMPSCCSKKKNTPPDAKLS